MFEIAANSRYGHLASIEVTGGWVSARRWFPYEYEHTYRTDVP